MKKLLVVLIILVLSICSITLAEKTVLQKHTSGDYEYVILDDGTAEIISWDVALYESRLTIPSKLARIPVSSIGDNVFQNCGNLNYIKIPDGVTNIGNKAFYYCNYLGHITIPDSLITIGDKAFMGCWSLENIKIPDGVTSIGNEAFRNCESLTSITIPDSVTNIGANPFMGCSYLADIQVSIDNSYLAISDGVLFCKQDNRLVCYLLANTSDSYIIPNGIQHIGDNAFYGCGSLISITIPDSVISIGKETFSHCRNLTSIEIPESVTNIGDYAFADCGSLKSIIIPDSVISIGEGAFSVYHYGDYIPNQDITVTVTRNSYAEQYCKDNGIKFAYPD